MSTLEDAIEFAQLTSEHVEQKESPNRPPLSSLDDIFGSDSAEEKKPGAVSQYAVHGPGYMPTTPTIASLPAGCYDVAVDNTGIYAVPALPSSGLLFQLPEMRSDEVIKLVERFWDSEKNYKEGNEFVVGGATYKAGVMIYGPAGSGKSSTIKIVSKQLVERGGIVFYSSLAPEVTLSFLTDFSRIEKNRKCIVIFEDIDSLIDRFGESGFLEMLDSAKSIDNVLFIATTNYPEKLDPRIYNRPGRFSHVVKIGLPTAEARRAFLKATLKNHRDVDYIVSNTEKFTIDHLSALINAIYREGKDLKTEIERLRILFRTPKSTEDRSIGM